MDQGSSFVVTPRTVLGITIALFGVALTLDRLGVAEADRLLHFWPVPLMLIGGLMFVQARDGRERTRGIVFAGIGTWLFLNMQGLVSVHIWELFWPVVLIAVGISLAFRSGRRTPRLRGAALGYAGAGSADRQERLSLFAVWSSFRRTSNAAPFRGGDITAIMGGGQLDLRLATIPAGEEAVLDIVAVMGGVEILVPPQWEVSTPILPFMGGVEDRRFPPLPADPSAPKKDAPSGRLVLRGFVMMGGVHIKN